MSFYGDPHYLRSTQSSCGLQAWQTAVSGVEELEGEFVGELREELEEELERELEEELEGELRGQLNRAIATVSVVLVRNFSGPVVKQLL